MQRSAHRLALPELSVSDFIESLRQLIAVDGDWVPSAPETSLYFRPFMIANEVFLGVRAAHRVSYMVIASPAGAYFAQGVAPVKIWLTEDYSRAGRGGTGAAKCGGNYASSLLPQVEAYENGCAQVLFLDAETGTHVDELGGMNIFFVHKSGRLITPALSGTILPGITRDSILTLARDRGLEVEERNVSIHEWKDGVASGDVTEVFACGTAAVITPIGALVSRDFTIGNADAPAGELTMSLRKELTDIQYGRLPDRHGWLTRLDA
jgi:branched-chain amino acid aminotransferase